MSTVMDDDNSGWKVPEPAPTTDRTHAARVKLLQAAIARHILEIPADVSKRGRAIRIGKISEQVSRFRHWMCETHKHNGAAWITITDRKESDRWIRADIDAWDAIKAAMAAGEDLARFLFEPEVAAS